LVWLVIHEFTHLFKDGNSHEAHFFARVAAIADENVFLFS